MTTIEGGGMATKCPNCGAEVADDLEFCGHCGKKIEKVQSRSCVGCGRTIPFDAQVCQYCGRDYRPQARVGLAGGAAKSFLSSRTTLLGFAVLALGALVLFYAVGDFIWLFWDRLFGTGVYLAFEAVIGIVLLIIGLMVVMSER